MNSVELVSADGVSIPTTITHAASPISGVLLAHGITADRDEDGFFTGLAGALAKSEITSLRFDFRGHGQSEIPSRDFTIAGEVLDLSTSLSRLRELLPDLPRGIVAASFGAVASSRLLAERSFSGVDFLVLINPVLDTRRTFTEPELPWAQSSFTKAALEDMQTTGVLLIDDSFEIGEELVREMHAGPQPFELLAKSSIPILVVHGTDDTYVSFEIARSFAVGHPTADFVAIEGAEHGFGRAEESRQVFDTVTSWIHERL